MLPIYLCLATFRPVLKPLILACDAAVAALLMWLVNRVQLGPFSRAQDGPWTERARILYPARIGAAVSVWLLPANIALAQSLLPAESTPHWGLVAVAAWL